ncbi:hypothetical protein Syun_003800 [Stephania yunnanensis]|uniref:Uncharacterized protein n=1 Tax=Stephania yunnanensis TaxID=152371 RepID=A0AAP0L1U2_9MAGN
MPKGAQVMARSSKTRVEMFRYRNHIMGIQGHPSTHQTFYSHSGSSSPVQYYSGITSGRGEDMCRSK